MYENKNLNEFLTEKFAHFQDFDESYQNLNCYYSNLRTLALIFEKFLKVIGK